MGDHSSGNHPYAFPELPQAFPGSTCRLPACPIGTGGHQRHAQPAANFHGIGVRIHPQRYPSRLPRWVQSSAHQRGYPSRGRNEPGVCSRPAGGAPCLLRRGEWHVVFLESLGTIRNENEPLVGRSSFQCEQGAQPACIVRIATQAEDGTGCIGNEPPLAKIRT